jgi:hypothetical protein
VSEAAEPWQDAATEADYRWQIFMHSKTPTDQAQALVDLSNAMHDLRTWIPGYDYETGSLPWERELDDAPNEENPQ